MLNLISLFIIANTIIFNLIFNVMNEEFIICYNLVIFFLLLYIMLKKGVTFNLYQASRFSYLVFVYLYRINKQIIQKVKKIFNFLYFRFFFNNLSEFIYGLISFNSLYIVMKKVKSINILIYFIYNFLKTIYFVNINSFINNKLLILNDNNLTNIILLSFEKNCISLISSIVSKVVVMR